MPQRGEVYRPVMNVDVATGEAEEDVVWIPFLSAPEPVIVPDELLDGGPRVRSLPTVKAYGPDLVCEQYAWIASYRVLTSSKMFVLAPDDRVDGVLAQVGGRGFYQLDVMRLVGDLVGTDGGAAYATVPCFRSRLPLDESLAPVVPPGNAVGWLVFHEHERAERLDVDWLRPDTAAAWARVPELEVRLDRAVAGGGDNIYAPVHDRSGAVVEQHVMSRALTSGSLPRAGASYVVASSAPSPAAVAGATVLPEPPRRRRLFGR